MVGDMFAFAGIIRALSHMRADRPVAPASEVVFSSLGPCNTRSMSYTELAI